MNKQEGDKIIIDFADELPAETIPDIETWSENYCWTGYDYENHIGYWLHLGRWVEDPTIWREEIVLLMPDGSTLFRRAFGKADKKNTALGALLQQECIEPGKRWQLRYNGPVQRATLPEQFRAPLSHANDMEHVEFLFDFASAVPVWKYADHDNTTIGKWHYEQHGKITGSCRFQGKEIAFKGHGYRDHTRGPRELSPVRGHCWIQGRYDDGDEFSLYHLWHVDENNPDQDKEELATVKYVEQGNELQASIVKTPRLRSYEDILAEGELILDVEGKGEVTIRCIPLNTALMCMHFRMSHLMFGAMLGDPDWPLTMSEQPAFFECNGSRAQGWIERSYYRDDRCFSEADVKSLYERNRQLK